jgi:hypothetical protein
MSKGLPAALAVVTVVTATLVLAAPVSPAVAAPARVICTSSPLEGSWNNLDPTSRSLARVQIQLLCSDVVFCDPSGHCTGGDTYLRVRPWGRCRPTNCDWGWRRLTHLNSGWERAVYQYSWSTKHVYLRLERRGFRRLLHVRVWTDFTAADGRTDYWSDDRFRKTG